MVLAVPALLALAGLVVALGMTTMGEAFTNFLVKVVAKSLFVLPFIGPRLARVVFRIGQGLNALFSAASLQLEGAISDSWHVMANLIEQTGEAVWDATVLGARALYAWEVQLPLRLAKLAGQLAENAGGQARTALRPVVKNYYRTTGITRAQLARFTKRLATIEARMASVPLLGAGAIALPFPRIGSLERRARAQGKRLSKVERKLGAVTFAALVSGALVKLGAGWIRCTNFRKTGKRICGMDPDLLESLLGGALLLTSAISLEQLARELQEPAELVTDAMHRLVKEF